jgi:hypothetical protein
MSSLPLRRFVVTLGLLAALAVPALALAQAAPAPKAPATTTTAPPPEQDLLRVDTGDQGAPIDPNG